MRCKPLRHQAACAPSKHPTSADAAARVGHRKGAARGRCLGNGADPRSRSFGTIAWKTRAVVSASPAAEWRPEISTPSQAASCIQAVIRQLRLDDFGEDPRVEREWSKPGRVRAPAFAPKDCEVEIQNVADHDAVPQQRREFRPHLAKGRLCRHHTVVDSVNGADRFRNRYVRSHEPPLRRLHDPPPGDRHRGNLDDPGLSRIEPGRFGVDHDGIERDQWRCVAESRPNFFPPARWPGANGSLAGIWPMSRIADYTTKRQCRVEVRHAPRAK